MYIPPPLEEAMVEAGMQEIEIYVARRQNTVMKYIFTRPIIYLCLAEVRRPRARF